ncbi:hypothetical protein [Kutzneria buriramensis]|uniref:Uncharacterized protein n=1 Tax=Kutzneria buriramensis TaxID=1045776 RepID=A0A3E0H0A0_9PSEU|nr:hypothetical protein [Kutzneria buriramensis]REH34850.1 hypothetical protein BCF44_119126 [Kutzneria buriramensis]
MNKHWWLAAVAVVVLVGTAIVIGAQLPSDTAAPPSHPPTATTTNAATVSRTTPVPAAKYQLLWPFADERQAAAWQAGYRAGGHQPWHLDADLTAQSFTQGYLRYGTLDQVTSVSVVGTDARVGVGYKRPDGSTATAAVIHLVKISSGTDAPWEVVGTDDTAELTLTTPAYGAIASPPVTVGGRITGVDESLRIQVLRLADENAIGQAGGIPAGGQNAPWTAQVSFTAPADSTLTIAVSTGGHVNDVERFAVTGVRSLNAIHG